MTPAQFNTDLIALSPKS